MTDPEEDTSILMMQGVWLSALGPTDNSESPLLTPRGTLSGVKDVAIAQGQK